LEIAVACLFGQCEPDLLGDGVRTLAGYANTSSHGRVRFVISLKSNNGALRFQLLRAIESEL
jgi:D-alanyl-D-alanine carboxypeptidase/D-alanyl-D-alanine-endopeptidase (penicillin-binding protein 4)